MSRYSRKFSFFPFNFLSSSLPLLFLFPLSPSLSLTLPYPFLFRPHFSFMFLFFPRASIHLFIYMYVLLAVNLFVGVLMVSNYVSYELTSAVTLITCKLSHLNWASWLSNLCCGNTVPGFELTGSGTLLRMYISSSQ